MNKGFPFIVLLMTLISGQSIAQYFQFSQYNFTTQRINPAMVAASDYASLGMIYRNQSAAGDIALRSSMVNASYPLLSSHSGLRWSGIGVSAMDDRTSGIFSIQEASLSYAVNIFLSRYQTLSLGMKGLFQKRKINMEGLVTGSQYIPDRGFDESIYNGENIQFMQSNFFTLSAGLYWQQTDKQNRKLAYWGASFFDFNKPEDSFSGIESRLSSTMVFNGGVMIYRQDNLSVTPELLYTRSSSNNLVNIGFVTGYELDPNSKQFSPRIDLLTKYVLGRSAILGLQLHRENFSFGISYDFPFVTRNAANFSTIEVALELRRLVDPRLKRKTQSKKRRQPANQVVRKPEVKPKATTPTPENKEDSISQPTPVKPDLKASLKHKQDSALASAEAGKIKHAPLILEKITLHFNFDFNSSDLDEESEKYLEDLTAALLENDHLKIRLTGHTDNVGSARFNEKLSLFRADAIKQFLVEQGVNASRIETSGKGLTEPLNDNRTEADRAKNRRVELVILYE